MSHSTQHQAPHLSKSRFIAGLQCRKRLYLTVYPPEADPQHDEETLAMINGYEVGDLACKLYPGVMVEYRHGMTAALKTTKALIADTSVQRIHEATFSHEGVLVRVDLLERSQDGWILTEVKSSTKIKDYYLDDAAVQAWVLQGCGLKLDAVRLMHIDNSFVYHGDGNYDGLLHAEEITARIKTRIANINEERASLMDTLAGTVPEIAMGSQCKKPFPCQFISYCQQGDVPEYPLSVLPRLQEQELQSLTDAGYTDLRDIPDGVLNKPNHQRVWRVTCANREEYDAQALSALIDWAWPRYYLDFETIALAVPRWQQMRPYQQAPFQFSLHVHHKDGRLDHYGFLDLSGKDPRRACAEELVKQVENNGVIVAYNASFEKSVIRELAALFPDLADALMAMVARFADLLPITRNGYCHPQQKGSWSIKAVLPALVPDLNYGDLQGVQNGSDAQLAWMQAVRADHQQQNKLGNQLLRYCELDTLAMVRMVEELTKRALQP